MVGFSSFLGNLDAHATLRVVFRSYPQAPRFCVHLIKIDPDNTIHDLSPLSIWSMYVLVQLTVRGFQPPRRFIVADRMSQRIEYVETQVGFQVGLRIRQ